MAWAMFPTAWIKPKGDKDDFSEVDMRSYPLAELHWRDHRAAGIAALLVLMTLAVRLNQSYKKIVYEENGTRPNKVAVTWDDLQEVTGCARATLGKAIMLLENWKAIKVTKIGRANHYELIDVHAAGCWCQLPQTFLEKNGDPVARFKNLPANSLGLNALKLYILLLVLRSSKTGSTSISYDGITKWTGIRREDIRKAWGFLDGQQLATVTHMRDARHSLHGGNDQSQRYAIYGVTPGYTSADAELAELHATQMQPVGPTATAPPNQ